MLDTPQKNQSKGDILLQRAKIQAGSHISRFKYYRRVHFIYLVSLQSALETLVLK